MIYATLVDDYDGGEFTCVGEIAKVDSTLGLVFGYAIVSKVDGEPYVDRHDHHIPEKDMLEKSLNFFEHSRIANDMHALDSDGEPVPAGEVVFGFPLTTEIAKGLGIEASRTGLLIGMKPSDDVFAKFEDGTYTQFSIGGRILEEPQEV